MTDEIDDWPENGDRLVRADADWSGTTDDGGRWKRLGRLAGGDRLGCTLEELPPGHDPLPYHYHEGNEEASYVLEGRGTLRTPDGETTIEAGDYVTFPAGESGAHTVENAGEGTLRCLFFSTMNHPDVVVYPDTKELQVVTGAAPGSEAFEFSLSASFPLDEE